MGLDSPDFNGALSVPESAHNPPMHGLFSQRTPNLALLYVSFFLSGLVFSTLSVSSGGSFAVHRSASALPRMSQSVIMHLYAVADPEIFMPATSCGGSK